MDTPYRIELFGELRVRQHAGVITRFRTHKAAALLSFLALGLRQTHSREQLVDLFWPEMEVEAGRSNLRTALTSLRRQLEPPGAAGTLLVTDRQYVHLNRETVSTDVEEFDHLLHAVPGTQEVGERLRLLECAVELYRGELLPGQYSDWAVREQTRYQEKYLNLLHLWRETLAQAGEWMGALEAAERTVLADPYSEEAYLAKMRLYLTLQRPAAALETYRRLEDFLTENMGVRPTRAACELAEALRRDLHTVGSGKVSPLSPNPVVPSRPRQAQSVPHFVSSSDPSPSSVAAPSLPLQLTRLFGRHDEMRVLEALLAAPDIRLLTLLGHGGVGKTRLAIEVAKRMTAHFQGRIWFVSLAELPDARNIPLALLHALKLPPMGQDDPLNQVVEALGTAPCLLVLDNFEHLLREALFVGKSDTPQSGSGAVLVRMLLERVPNLTCLITSRQGLRLGGEQEFLLSPLPLPPFLLQESVERLSANASIALYTDRAKSIKADFALSAHNVATVAALCRKLEGIPLAIEMAAAWARTLSPSKMLERLESRLDLLVSRRRDLPQRHQSLRATIEWSYDLLEAPVQVLFAWLAVFRGGWTLETAEAVCGAETLPGLEVLLEASLVVREERQRETRYRMLETLHAFADEKLSQCGERAFLQARHADVFVRLAETVEPHLYGADQGRWYDHLEAERENLRVALEWLLEAREDSPEREEAAQKGLRLTGALGRFWDMRGYWQEGEAFLSRALARPGAEVPTLCRAYALCKLGWLARIRKDLPNAKRLALEALEIARAHQNQMSIMMVNHLLGVVTRDMGDYETSKALFEEILEHSTKNGIEDNTPWTNLGFIAKAQGDHAKARRMFEEALAINRRGGRMPNIAVCLSELGQLFCREGDFASARVYLSESLTIAWQHGIRVTIMNVLDKFGSLAAAMQRFERAVHLWSAAETHCASHHLVPSFAERDLNAVREALSAARFVKAWEEGSHLSLKQAVVYALETPEA